MAIKKKLIHFKKWSDFSSKKLSANEQNTQYTLGVDGALTTGAPDVLYQSVCWIKDVKKMWTHGTLYDCSGGGGVIVETDPIFSNSPAATITEAKKTEWDNKVPYASKDFLIVGADGFMTSDGDGFVFPGTPASQDGQGFVLATLEDIPNALTESDIAAMGFTKNEGTITEVKMNGVSKGTTGVVDLGDVPTQESVGNLQDHVEDLWSEVGKLTQDKQDALKSGENIKTINGESILGSGDITISGGGSSSGGSGAYSEVNHGTSDTTFTLTPNTFHVWDEVASLTLDLGSETSGVANEYLFQFNSGATATSLTLPDDIKWANDTPPTIEPNVIYQVSILKGLASVLEFSNAPALIENKVTVSISGNKYLVNLQYAAASDIVVKVSTGDGLISANISSGEISRSVSPVGPMVDSSACIQSIMPIVDNIYNYVW